MGQFGYDGFGNFKVTDYLGEHAPTASGLRFKGEWFDAQTNEYFMRNRYYDAGTGQFDSMDPIGYQGGMNLYGYCGGDPFNNSDPMGTELIVNGEVISEGSLDPSLKGKHKDLAIKMIRAHTSFQIASNAAFLRSINSDYDSLKEIVDFRVNEEGLFGRAENWINNAADTGGFYAYEVGRFGLHSLRRICLGVC